MKPPIYDSYFISYRTFWLVIRCCLSATKIPVPYDTTGRKHHLLLFKRDTRRDAGRKSHGEGNRHASEDAVPSHGMCFSSPWSLWCFWLCLNSRPHQEGILQAFFFLPHDVTLIQLIMLFEDFICIFAHSGFPGFCICRNLIRRTVVDGSAWWVQISVVSLLTHRGLSSILLWNPSISLFSRELLLEPTISSMWWYLFLMVMLD